MGHCLPRANPGCLRQRYRAADEHHVVVAAVLPRGNFGYWPRLAGSTLAQRSRSVMV
jgi:hypothetical protein